MFKKEDYLFLQGVLYLVILSLVSSLPALKTWPLFWLVSLTVHGVLLFSIKPLRQSFPKISFGNYNKKTISLALLISILSIVTLVGFYKVYQPDMSGYKNKLPINALGGVLLMGIIFPIVNAISEELVFRVILFEAIDAQAGKWIAALVTSIIFGYIHMEGYPPGNIGALLAGIYGFSLACLRIQSKGIGLVIIVHIIADITIYCLIVK